MPTAVEEVLETLYEVELVLEELPLLSPDHETMRLAAARLRATYMTLATLSEDTAIAIAATLDTTAEARAVLDTVRAKRGKPRPPG